MKNLLYIFIFLILIVSPVSVQAEVEDNIIIHYFQNEYCDSCQETKEFFNEYYVGQDNITIIYYDTFDTEDRLLMEDVLAFYDARYETPTIVVGGTLIQGSKPIESYLDSVINYYQNQIAYIDVVEKIQLNEGNLNQSDIIQLDQIIDDDELTFDLPIFGTINLTSFSLLLGAVFIGLIDGFNPCAMWVLVFLITMLINLKDRKRIWILGMTFILTSGVVYYVIMMAWFQLVNYIIWLRTFQVIIGILAVVFAYISIKHYWNQRQKDIGCEVTTSETKKRIMNKIKSVIGTNNIWLAVLGIITIAITVNFIELACSAGLPAVYTSMLAYQNIGQFQSAMYLLVYVFFFVLDDLLIFAIAIITFKVTGISNKYTKYSNLIGGLIMLFIGLSLVFFPQLLF